jgi:hypothetical protein
MKLLRPSTIVILGPLLLGVAFAVGSSFAMPRSHELPSFVWLFAIGATMGFVVFGPIAAMLAVGRRYPDWLDRQSWRIGFYSSVAMGTSLGYLAACMRHSVSDNLMLAAFAILFLGATIKTGLSYALRQLQKDSAP